MPEEPDMAEVQREYDAMQPKPRWKFERVAARSSAEPEPEGGEGEDDEVDPNGRSVKARADGRANAYAPRWKNPYAGMFLPERPKSLLTCAQRLASVMRVIGRPLSIMKGWPEVRSFDWESYEPPPGSRAAEEKARVMAEQKAILVLRATLEKSIERLAARREALRAELGDVEDELKKMLAMLRASGADEEVDKLEASSGVKVKGKGGRKPKAEANGKSKDASGPAAVIVAHLASEKDATLTPDQAAKLTGQDPKSASQTLGRLARLGQIERVSRGLYGPA